MIDKLYECVTHCVKCLGRHYNFILCHYMPSIFRKNSSIVFTTCVIIDCLRVSHLFVLHANLFERCSGCERLTELCAISDCEQLLCIIKTILTKYDLSVDNHRRQGMCVD